VNHSVGQQPDCVAVGDFNGNGKMDLANGVMQGFLRAENEAENLDKLLFLKGCTVKDAPLVSPFVAPMSAGLRLAHLSNCAILEQLSPRSGTPPCAVLQRVFGSAIFVSHLRRL
jgi:hypothetical protein